MENKFYALESRSFQPDWQGLLDNINMKATPKRVYHIELFHDKEIEDAIIERYELEKNLNPAAEDFQYRRHIAFRRFCGFDFVRCGLDDVIWKFNRQSTIDPDGSERTRVYQDGHQGPIMNWKDFEEYPWPDPSTPQACRRLEWYEKNLPEEMLNDGFKFFAEMFNPILDVFAECGVKFALEVHPTEIAFDIITTKRALETIGNRPEFGFNFDPSHLLWQMFCPVKFLQEFPDRIYHVHMKDAALQLDGRTGILASHLDFGQAGRGWDFRSLGHGDVDFENIIRELNRIGYTEPLSVEWEDCSMEREYGAQEACEFVNKVDFSPSTLQFDGAFDN